MNDRAERLAVVLFNLGGPDSQAQVRPFLESLFGDPAILPLPGPLRLPAAWLLARARLESARANYALMGGGSPLLAETRAQGAALQARLETILAPTKIAVFIAMRHAPPKTAQAAARVAAFGPDQIVLAPLYPQFSTTTTASSLKAWREAYRGPGETRAICCWHAAAGLIEAHVEAIESTWRAAGSPPVRLLFSAHGLPTAVIARGDPYQWQVESTCARIAARLGPSWDWRVCYQSRVGPTAWLEPSTPQAIAQAAKDGVGVLVDPVAFVCEHVETLVELDHDYRRLAERLGVGAYLRVPALGISPVFIDGLAQVVAAALSRPRDGPDGEACPASFVRCGRARLAGGEV